MKKQKMLWQLAAQYAVFISPVLVCVCVPCVPEFAGDDPELGGHHQLQQLASELIVGVQA